MIKHSEFIGSYQEWFASNSFVLEWFQITRKIDIEHIDTNSIVFCLLLFTFDYYTMIVYFCFTGFVKSL